MQSRGPWRQHYRALKGRGRLAFTCTCSSRRLAAPASDTSAWKAAWTPRGAPSSLPGPPSSCTVCRAAAPSRSQAATAAPSAARRTLTARPMPPPAPGTGEDKRAWGQRSAGRRGSKTRAGDQGDCAARRRAPDVTVAPQSAREEPPTCNQGQRGAQSERRRHDSQRPGGAPRWATPSAEGARLARSRANRSPAGGHRRGRPPAAGA